jgi:hypothetical protein
MGKGGRGGGDGEDLRKGGENNKIDEQCEASKTREYTSITRSRGTFKRITDP